MSEDFVEEKRTMSVVVRYTIVGIILAIFTAIEVAVLYPPIAKSGDTFKIALLVGLSVLKFVAVVALFMHLWHDPFLYTGIFVFGFLLAAGTMVALIAVVGVHPLPENAVKAPTEEELERRKHEKKDEHHAIAPAAVTDRLAQYRRLEASLA